MCPGDSTEGIRRRDVLGGMALFGLLGAAGTGLSQATAQAASAGANFEEVRKVLIERLVNTRYYTGPDGSVYVLPGDEVWPGESGGAYHADWLFNQLDGLKHNSRAALSDKVVAESEHFGVPSGADLSPVDEILKNAEMLGLLDDFGLIYRVFREKIAMETMGAHDYGVQLFREWAASNPELSDAQRAEIDAATVAYLNVARPHDHHLFY
jgi:hypothetical protein